MEHCRHAEDRLLPPPRALTPVPLPSSSSPLSIRICQQEETKCLGKVTGSRSLLDLFSTYVSASGNTDECETPGTQAPPGAAHCPWWSYPMGDVKRILKPHSKGQETHDLGRPGRGGLSTRFGVLGKAGTYKTCDLWSSADQCLQSAGFAG